MHTAAPLRIALTKPSGRNGNEHAFCGAAVQRSHLRQRRSAFGLYLRCKSRSTGRLCGRHHCAGSLPVPGTVRPAGRFCNSMELYPAHRAGYRPCRHQTLRLPGPPEQKWVSFLEFWEYFSIILEKILAKWFLFRYNGSAWSETMTIITPHTR